MKTLPLYKDSRAPWTSVEIESPLDRDALDPVGRKDAQGNWRGRACTRCPLGSRETIRNPCIAAVGDVGGLMVIGEAPGKYEDIDGAPFVGESGKLLKRVVSQNWKGPVAYDNAVRCFPGGVKLKDKFFDQCRGYLTAEIEAVRPTRIITVGAWAAYSLFGRSVPPLSSRRAYGWLRGENLGRTPIAVFMVIHPAAALRNRFVQQWFEADLKHALTAPDPPEGPWRSMAHVVETEADALKAERDLMTNDWVTFDVETMGRMWTPEFTMISCAVCGDSDEEPWVWDEAALYDEKIRAPLLRVLASKKIAKVGSNVKYDQLAFRSAFGALVRPIAGDTRLSRKLLDPEAAGKLAAMAELVGMGGLKQDAEDRMSEIESKTKRRIRKQWAAKNPKPLIEDEPLVPGFDLHPKIDAAMRAADREEVDEVAKRFRYGMLPHAELVAYNARDSVATARVEHYVRERLPEAPSLQRTWESLVLPGARALEYVETWGIAASVNAITSFDRFLTAKEQLVLKQLSVYPDVDWNSPQQVGKLLYDVLKLPVLKHTPSGGRSTDEEVLELLAKRHPIANAIVEHRSVVKLKGTYASGMLPHVRPDGRIHPNIKLDGARSGRTSCTDPNLQNIPRAQSQEGKMARDCFIAPDGFLLLEVDYSQLELRVAAMLSQDPVMLEIFASGVDYHLRTAQLISQNAWGIPPEAVEDKHRSLAKSVNFGILYGKTARTLAEEWGVSQAKAQQVVDAIMGNFKVLEKWCRARRSEAEKHGEVWTWWDGEKARRRPLYRVADKGNDSAQSTARNGAVNSPIQGTASDFCIASLIDTVDWINSDGIADDVKLCLAVHDALLLEVRTDMVDEAAHTLHAIMTGHNSLGVPLDVDFKVGPAWGSMEKYKLPKAA